LATHHRRQGTALGALGVDFKELLGAAVGQQQLVEFVDRNHRFGKCLEDLLDPFAAVRGSPQPHFERGPAMLGLLQLRGQAGERLSNLLAGG
jgi:hypothetical protein